MLVERLDFGPDVREALAFTFERWNGKGFPTHTGGEAIPLAAAIFLDILNVFLLFLRLFGQSR